MSIEGYPPLVELSRSVDEDKAVAPDGLSEQLGKFLSPDFPMEDLARQATELTRQHFAPEGEKKQQILLYAPLYVSSYCLNHCVYCGFREPEQIERRHLSVDEALAQAEILEDRGFRHILLVAGDCPQLTTTEYYAEIIRKLVARGVCPAVEIAPQPTDSYAALAAAGVCGVTLYQETYNKQLYAMYHPQGSKTSYDWRLEGLQRAAEAGIRRLGLGILLGLGDPREELPAMVRHAEYLRSRFPDCTIALSLPRIHAAPKDFDPPYPVDDETFVRMYCALRLAFLEATLVLSTRESAALRSRLVNICITQLSAGSSTQPGGYAIDEEPCGQQFPVTDDRTPDEVADWLCNAGFTVTWEMGHRADG